MEGGEQEECGQSQKDIRRSNEEQNTEEEILSVIFRKQQFGVEAIFLNCLEDQYTKGFNDTQKSQFIPETVRRWEHSNISQSKENGGDNGDDMTNVPSELQRFDCSGKVRFWRCGGSGSTGISGCWSCRRGRFLIGHAYY